MSCCDLHQTDASTGAVIGLAGAPFGMKSSGLTLPSVTLRMMIKLARPGNNSPEHQRATVVCATLKRLAASAMVICSSVIHSDRVMSASVRQAHVRVKHICACRAVVSLGKTNRMCA